MAESDDQPKVKRHKHADIHEIFYDFFKKEDALKDLEYTCSALEEGLERLYFLFYKLNYVNARVSRNFSEADVETELYKVGCDNVLCFPVENIFVDGSDLLRNFLDQRLPVDETLLKALSKLLQFLCSTSDHQILMEEKNTECAVKGRWEITVAQHLLTKLSVHTSYTVDTCLDSAGQSSYTLYKFLGVTSRTCPCKEHDEMVGQFGDTSYGCADGWHGSADILLDEAVPVMFIRGNQAGEDRDNQSASSEEKSETYFSDLDKAKLIAETIVFSFLKNNERSFVPGIGISSGSLIVYFFDSKNDLLIGTPPIDLFSGNKIVPHAVTFLWLVLNYKLFCSGTTESMKTYKAAFFDNVQERSYFYTEKLSRPCIAPPKSRQTEESLEQLYQAGDANIIHFKLESTPQLTFFRMPDKM